MRARFLRVTKLASMPAGNQTVPPLSLQLPQGLSLSPSAKPLNSALPTGIGAGGVIQNFASGCAGCFLFFLFSLAREKQLPDSCQQNWLHRQPQRYHKA